MNLCRILWNIVKGSACMHRKPAIIRKYSAKGKRLQVHKQFYSCIDCGATLGTLNYLKK